SVHRPCLAVAKPDDRVGVTCIDYEMHESRMNAVNQIVQRRLRQLTVGERQASQARCISKAVPTIEETDRGDMAETSVLIDGAVDLSDDPVKFRNKRGPRLADQ